MEPTAQETRLPTADRPSAAHRTGRDLFMAAMGAAVALAFGVLLRDCVLPPRPDAVAAGTRNDAVATGTRNDAVATGTRNDALVNEAAATVVALATDAPPGAPARSVQGLGAFPVRNARGETVSIVDDGEPAIVMINSRTCGYCKAALRDLGLYANGRPASRLRMLTLEGAADGEPMLTEANIRGAVPLGPATSQSQVLITFRYRGTPTFVAVDGQGRIRGTLPGYPGPERLATWFDVMLGQREVPVLD
jgi:hypothetical protein